jgi:hypothetical protein
MKWFFILIALLAPCGALATLAADSDARPSWVESGNEALLPAHTEVVTSELWATRDEAKQDALAKAAIRTREFAAQVAPRIKTAWQVPAWLLEDHMLTDRIYVEEVDWTYGPMYRAHLLINLSPENRQLLLNSWHQELVRHRLGQVGGALAFVLVCLATVLGYLRLDDATRGYYTGWLFAAAAAVVGGAGAALYAWVL